MLGRQAFAFENSPASGRIRRIANFNHRYAEFYRRFCDLNLGDVSERLVCELPQPGTAIRYLPAFPGNHSRVPIS